MNSATTNQPGKPKASGYAEPKPNAAGAHDKPDPEAPGGEASQVAATGPDEDEETPEDGDDAPPGEHKREPIRDPDPADTKLRVQAPAVVGAASAATE